MTFWQRLLRLNAPFLAAALRRLADDVELLIPGAPALGFVLFKKGAPRMNSITVKDSDAAFGATVSFLDAKGSPTSPDDTPAWESSDAGVCSVEAAPDGLSATLTPGSPGAASAATAQITVSSTDLDGTEITAVGTVTVTAGEAAVGQVDFAAAQAPAVPEPAPAEPAADTGLSTGDVPAVS